MLRELLLKASGLIMKGDVMSAEQIIQNCLNITDSMLERNDKNDLELISIQPYGESSTYGGVVTPCLGTIITIEDKSNWIEFVGNEDLFGKATLDNCLCKFDNGMEVRYNDFHPMAILTHFKIESKTTFDKLTIIQYANWISSHGFYKSENGYWIDLIGSIIGREGDEDYEYSDMQLLDKFINLDTEL